MQMIPWQRQIVMSISSIHSLTNSPHNLLWLSSDTSLYWNWMEKVPGWYILDWFMLIIFLGSYKWVNTVWFIWPLCIIWRFLKLKIMLIGYNPAINDVKWGLSEIADYKMEIFCHVIDSLKLFISDMIQITLLDFLIDYMIFLKTEVTRWVTVSTKHGVAFSVCL